MQGSLASAPEARFTGTFAAASASLQQLAQTGGYFVQLPAPFEDFTLNAEANISADSASFPASICKSTAIIMKALSR